ncbi:MAG: hypothetical protein ABWZ63_04605, partial [Thermoleophilaceae bacterium]
ITGRLARFGRGGMIQDISNRLLKDFADCLQQRIEAGPAAAESASVAPAGRAAAAPGGEAADPTAPEPAAARSLAAPLPAAKPISGFSLFFRALWDRIRRIFGRGPR